MMYILGETGQMCNQLFRLAHHIGNSLQYNYHLTCTAFRYKAYFPNLASHPLMTISHQEANWQRKLNKAIAKSAGYTVVRRLLSQVGVAVIAKPCTFTDADSTLVEVAKQKPVLVTTWLFRDYININRNAASIRNLFKPDPRYIAQANQLLQLVRQQQRPVIGVHIRRGDYINWEEGRYYFTDSVYRNLMEHLLTLPGLANAAFAVCSNEPIDLTAFEGLLFIESANNHFMTDLTLLSCCDYLIGPPSTFSAWASFMGQVPLHHILTASHRPVLNEFMVTNG